MLVVHSFRPTPKVYDNKSLQTDKSRQTTFRSEFNTPSFMAAKENILYLVPNLPNVNFSNIKPEMEELVSKYLGESMDILKDKFLPNFLKPIVKRCREKGVFICLLESINHKYAGDSYYARFQYMVPPSDRYFTDDVPGDTKSEAIATLIYFYVDDQFRLGPLAADTVFGPELKKKILTLGLGLQEIYTRVTPSEYKDLLKIIIPDPPIKKGQNILLL